VILFVPGGDLDSDGLEERYTLRFLEVDGSTSQSSYVVRGSDGGRLFVRRGEAPILGSLDGDGDDVVRVDQAGRTARVIAIDGESREVLWRAPVPGRISGPASPYGSAARLREAATSDLVLTTRLQGGIWIVGMDGRDGTVMWWSKIT
jgi:hypothetical protein